MSAENILYRFDADLNELSWNPEEPLGLLIMERTGISHCTIKLQQNLGKITSHLLLSGERKVLTGSQLFRLH